MARQQAGNNHQLAPSHHRIDNSRLIINSTCLKVDTLDRDISKHFIHFTEGECSDTGENRVSSGHLVLEQLMNECLGSRS